MSKDWFKIVTGQTLKQFTKRPAMDDSVSHILRSLSSGYPLRLLGVGEQEVYVSEEEREVNFHILGAPGEGKSKFLEYNIRQDILQGLGLCLLDPSEGGDTVKNVLAFCESIGHEKVILIDPNTIQKYDKIPIIKALNPKNIKGSVDGVMEALTILFGAKSDTDTPRIKRYLSATLRTLTKANLTLYESKYFADYNESKGYRDAIFERIYGDQRDVRTLKNVFKSEYTWEGYYSSTINRLDSLWDEPLSLMLGGDEGINFTEAVSRGWVILVNLSPYRLTMTESRLLGVMIISQLVQAIDTLVNNGWKGAYYLYMDEAGRYATPQLDQLLSYKRKSGLRLILAHHYFEQFEDRKVLNSIMNNARIKLMFDTPSHDDRMKMIKALGYGGDIPPLLANYANQNVPKQYAIIRKNKEAPQRIRIPDVVPLPPVSDEYLNRILQAPFYKSKEEIKNEINARLVPTYLKRTERGKASDSQADHGNPLPKRGRKSVPTDSKKPPIPKKGEPFKF